VIGVVGDRDPDNPNHLATEAALAQLGAELTWVSTVDAERAGLEAYDGLFVTTGSPYASMTGALRAIRFAREHRVPLLGTCGGFQHMVIEFARAVCGIEDAQHAEYDPGASRLVVSPLTCSLAGQTLVVHLAPGSRALDAYGSEEATERYFCSFALNPDYRSTLEAAGLHATGVDADGEVRVVELVDHPFFVGTLYVPQARSSPGHPHPLVRAFMDASVSAARVRARPGSSSRS
jgi:CTP synthase (UTP-ammonia lyase)